ncbi:MAG TPA: 3'-5' exonuclease [Chthoniobacteraceae bacterium]|jgi:inhibitor of KinA sporulation pathway (predicted exonuclease)
MNSSNSFKLIIDLEATCSQDGSVPRDEMEIIEIGAVMQNEQTLVIESEFQIFIRPTRHPILTPFCKELTGIKQEDVSDALPFPSALEKMRQWMSAFPNSLFCSWGNYDRNQFGQDCAHHNVPYPFGPDHLNLKAEFADAFNLRKPIGISGALKHFGLKFQGSPHRGLDDARNIAAIVQRMSA